MRGFIDWTWLELNRIDVPDFDELDRLCGHRWRSGFGERGRESWSGCHVGSCGYRCLYSGCAFLSAQVTCESLRSTLFTIYIHIYELTLRQMLHSSIK